jgi:hypothetical protein
MASGNSHAITIFLARLIAGNRAEKRATYDNKLMKKQNKLGNRLKTAGVCLGVVVTSTTALRADSGATDDGKVSKLEQENQDLKKRLDVLEAMAQKEGLLPSGQKPNPTLSFLAGSQLSGFVTASYFYDTSRPPGGVSPGYLWNYKANSFDINKIKITLGKAAEISGDKWDAGYNVMMIYGQDAKFVDTGPAQASGGGNNKGFDSLRQAYVELNVPVGNGIDVKAGQLISLLNYESGDGGAVNANFSQGNQWFFTGNGPSAGVQLSYKFCPMFDFTARVQNGLYAGAIDNNGYKTVMGSFGIHPDEMTSINLIGFGGREGASSQLWTKGGSVIASRVLAKKYNVTLATEFDYFSVDRAAISGADFWSIGGWLSADFTPMIGAALRIDYVADEKGAATGGLLNFAGGLPGQDLFSATATLNFRPVPSIKIQPEVRYDHTSFLNGFGTRKDRFIIGMGASYLF